MTIINPTMPTPGEARGSAEADITGALAALLADHNGLITDANLSATAAIAAGKLADAAKLGLTDGATIRRGKSIIATTESRTNTAYGLMTTPDRVSGIVLPTDGLIVVRYQATWQESVAGAARAAIFIGTNQLTAAIGQAGGPTPEAACTNAGASPGTDRPLSSFFGGLISATDGGYTGDVTTGQIVGVVGKLVTPALAIELGGAQFGLGTSNVVLGGRCEIFGAAGSYDISIQYKSSSGSMTVKNRRLLVETIGY